MIVCMRSQPVLWTGALTSAAGLSACSYDRLPASTSRPSRVPTVQGPAADNSPVEIDTYYLSTCAQCGGLLGAKGDSPEVVYNARSFRVCSLPCQEAFMRSPVATCERVDTAMIADQSPYYPLAVSLVSGRSLGEPPVEIIWGNRLFRAVDVAERDEILADPAHFVRLLNQAVITVQSPTYGMPDKCPVQGDILPSDDPIDIVVANRMIRVCCGRCARVVRARPYQYLGMVEYANRQRAIGERP